MAQQREKGTDFFDEVWNDMESGWRYDPTNPRGIALQVAKGVEYWSARLPDPCAPNGKFLLLGYFATCDQACEALRRAESMRAELPYLGPVDRRKTNKAIRAAQKKARLENPQPGDDEPIDWDAED